MRVVALAVGLALVALSTASHAQDGPNVTALTAAPSGPTVLANAPASIAGSGTWVSGCVPAGKYRAFDVFAALAAAGTLQVQRYADAACTRPVGPAVPTAALALTTGAGCPTSTNCGDVASNDGLPFLALKITLTDTSTATNAVNNVTLLQGAE